MSKPSNPNKTRRVAVLGSRAVGKSSMTVQFVEEHFVDNYYPTIENQFQKTIRYKGQMYDVDILDTAGQDEFSIINNTYLMGVHGYIIVYSVASKSTLDMVRIIYNKILNSLGTEKVPVCVVGNKTDLHLQRQVSREEGEELAKEIGAAFVETSARHNENVAKAFELLIAQIEAQQNPAPEAEKGCSIM